MAGQARVLGPYAFRNKWRLVVVAANGERAFRYFESEEAAKAALKEWSVVAEETNSVSIEEAITAYAKYQLDDCENKEESVKETSRRLRQFFTSSVIEDDETGEMVYREAPHALERAIALVTPEMAANCYDGLRKRPVEHKPRAEGTKYAAKLQRRRERLGLPAELPERPLKLLSVDTHRNILAQSKSFLGWCVKKRWLEENPLEDVKGTGKRRHGKPQLRFDEARRWLDVAVKLADFGEDGAIAAMMTLILDLRAREIVERIGRDVDNDGELLWIPDSKTEAGRRRVETAILAPYLRDRAKSKGPLRYLFESRTGGAHDRGWPREWVQRICDKARVPSVCAHAMRGLHASIAIENGATAELVASAMGHSEKATTLQSYATPLAQQNALRNRVIGVLGRGLPS